VAVNDIKRAIFLDRDGVLNPDEYGYLDNPEKYHLYPWTGEALRILKELGFLLFVVTNQSGIARGYFSVAQLEKVLEQMRTIIRAEGVELDGVFYSPYFKTGVVEPYNIDHEDRKPGIGMYKKAKAAFHFDPNRSWMIGDRETDLQFGRNAGLKTILLLSGNGRDDFLKSLSSDPLRPDYICENLLTAARLFQRFCL